MIGQEYNRKPDIHTVAFATAVTGMAIMWRFRLFLAQCVDQLGGASWSTLQQEKSFKKTNFAEPNIPLQPG